VYSGAIASTAIPADNRMIIKTVRTATRPSAPRSSFQMTMPHNAAKGAAACVNP